MNLDNNDYKKLISHSRNGRKRTTDLRSLKQAITESTQAEILKWSPIIGQSYVTENLPFQVLDFFCGCGGMSLGFAALSRVLPIIEIVGGCDIEKDALKTYELNFGAPGINLDIRELVDNDLALSDFLGMLPRYNRKRKTILIGCAPCQGFTSHRKRHWHKEDHRNTLVGAFASVAVKLAPHCIIMENVPEILSKKYWEHFIEAKEIFEEGGYKVSQTIYNAASFGVPQERFRAVIVAMKKKFLLPEPQILDSSSYKTVRSAIGTLPPVEPGETHQEDALHRSAAHRESTLRTIEAVPKNGGSRPSGIGPKCLDRVRGFYDVYGRLAWDRPAITITHYARNPASGRYVHPDQDRGLTIREASLLQSFPIGFEFCGSFDSIFKQIGEAVPPMLAAAIAASCMIEVLSKEPSNEDIEKGMKPIVSPVSSSFSSVIAGMKMARNEK